MTERTRSRVQAAEMRFLRRIVGVSRADRVRNATVLESVGIESLLFWVEKSQLRWLGHVLRMPQDRTVHRLLKVVLDTRRPVGRPRKRWIDQAHDLCHRIGLDKDQIEAQAEDRAGWRRLIDCLTPVATH